MSGPCGTSPVKFQLRRDTSTNWTNSTSVLALGEPGVETNTGQMKVGDGVHQWKDLPYVGRGTTGPTGPSGSGSNYAASYGSSQTFDILALGTTIFTYNQTYEELGISLVNGSRMTVSSQGIYELIISIQVDNPVSSAAGFLYVWIRVNGEDVPDSAGRLGVNVGDTNNTLPSVPYIIEMNAGDYVEVVARTDSYGIRALARGANSLNTMPAIPSITSQIKKIAVDIGTTGPIGPTGVADIAFYTKYFLDPPPAPLGLTIDSTNSSQYINVYWTYPDQINAGFLTTGWLPDITSFGAKLEGVTYNSLANQTVVLPTSDSHFVSQHNSTPVAVLLQLVPYVGTSSFIGDVTVGANTYQGYRICDANFSTMVDGAGQIRIWYNNYNLNSGSSAFSTVGGPITFTVVQGPPEQPSGLMATDSGVPASGGKTTETITFSKSSYANSSNHSDTTATISTYQYTYTLQSTASRYGGALSDSGTVSISVTNQTTPSYTSSPAFNPGSVYGLSLTATNGYALTCSAVTFTTPQTNFPTVPSATAFAMSNRYYSSVIRVSDSVAVTNKVLQTYTSWTSSGTFLAPIHTSANRGSTSTSLSTLVYSISGTALAGSPTFPTITYNGFGNSPSYVSSGSTTLITPTVSVTDAYANAPSQGFYLVGSNSFAVDLTQTTNFKNSNSLYTITTTAGASVYTSTFYYDRIIGAPSSVVPTIALGTNTSTSVSGLSVYGSTEAFSNQITCSNAGDYFCPSTIVTYAVSLTDASSAITVTGPSRTLTISSVSGDSIVSGAFKYGGTFGNIKLVFTDSESLDTYATATVWITGTVYNITSNVAFDSSGSSVVKIVIDQPSITQLEGLPATLPTVGVNGASSAVVGRVVKSGTTFNATTYAPGWYATNSVTSWGEVPYDHTALLTASSNYELMDANGKFRTIGTGGYYMDYTAYGNPNYSSIPRTSADYRFSTFAWKVDLGGGGTGNGYVFNRIAFTINRAKAGSLSYNVDNGTAYITGTSVYPLIYYRMEEQLYSGTDYRIPNNSTAIGSDPNYTSDWINMNVISITPVNSANYNNLTSTAGSPYVKSGFNGVSQNTNGDDGSVNYVFTPLLGYAAAINSLTYIYFRIMLPMDIDFEFASISANLYSIS